LATNARDAADANSFRVIADSWAFLVSIQNSVTTGKLTLSATQKAAFNDTVAAYNTAYALGLAYHSGASSNATDLNNATNTLVAKLANAKTVIPQ